MTPSEAGFDGAAGVNLNHPWMKDGGVFKLRRGSTLPDPECDYRNQLIWRMPLDSPPELLYCNANSEWFTLGFTPVSM